MTNKSALRLASAVVLLAYTLAAAGLVLLVMHRHVQTAQFGIRGFVAIFAVVFGGTGWLLASRRPSNPIGWLILVGGLASAIQMFLAEYIVLSYTRYGGSLAFTKPLGWLQSWMWIPATLILGVFLPLLFPSGRLPSRRWRPFVVFACGVGAFFALGLGATPGQLDSAPIGVQNPYAIFDETLSDTLAGVVGMLYAGCFITAIVTLIRRFRRSSGAEHEQMKWLAFATGMAGVSLVGSVIVTTAGFEGTLAEQVTGVPVLLSFAGISVAVAFAILTHRLYDIDVVINKTVVFGALAVFITIVYVAVVAGIGAAIGSTNNLGLSILATAIVALTIQPVRARASHFANRVVFGSRASPYETLSVFGERISASMSPDDVLPQLARLMTEATAAVRASVWLAVGSSLVAEASWPDERHEPVPIRGVGVPTIPGFGHVFPVRHQGEMLGALAVADAPAEPLSPAQEKLLSDLAAPAALVLRNGRLIAELQASRQRLVTTADQERRRIERNLHDGAQQQLVALAVKIGLVSRFLNTDAESAERVLGELRTDASDALDNLRDLARGIYPPVLADQGLAAAIRSQAHKSALAVDVDAGGIERYAQEVESAVYFCVLEGLQNIAKYSGASSARVALWSENGRLAFSVSDDGSGFDPGAKPRGSGLTNMSDRLEALGGTLEIRSSPGAGTTITGRLPAQL